MTPPNPNVEQLKMIQAIIARLAGNSFLLKGWTVTLVAGLSAFAKDDSDRHFAFIAVAVAVTFALLDAYYLALERRYIALYNKESKNPDGTAWSLKADPPSFVEVVMTVGRPAIWPLYLVAIAGALAVALL